MTDRFDRLALAVAALCGAAVGALAVGFASRLGLSDLRPDRPPADPVFLIRSGDAGAGPSAAFDLACHGPLRVRLDLVAVIGTEAKSICSSDTERDRGSIGPDADPWWGVRAGVAFASPGREGAGAWSAWASADSFDLDRAGSRDPDPPPGYLPGGGEWTRTDRLSASATSGGWDDGRASGASSASAGGLPAELVPRSWTRRLIGRVPEGAGEGAGLVAEVIRLGGPFPVEPMFADPPEGDRRPPADAFDDLNDGTLTPRTLVEWNAARLAAGEEPVGAAFVVIRWVRPADGADSVSYDELDDLPVVAEARERRRAERANRR